MNKTVVVIIVVVLVILGGIYTLFVAQKPAGSLPLSGQIYKTEPMVSEKFLPGYQGKILAGDHPYIFDFVKSDYEQALQSDRLIVLYFYADWCPECKKEIPELYSAFDELSKDSKKYSNKVVGFRVNFNDSETDSDEENLAREYGVAYQHTKVFVKNGQRILKSPESWDKERYLDEINKAL